MTRSFLFVAGTSRAWGEMVYGLRIGHELLAQGDRVAVLAPAAMQPLLRGTPFRFGRLDEPRYLVPAISTSVRDLGIDVVLLVDLATVFLQLKALGADASFLSQLPVPVLALDVWDLPRTNMTWDLGAVAWHHSPHALRVTQRLVPSPLAPPHGDCVFNALPRERPEPSNVRDELRLDASTRVVFMPTASWQQVQSNELAPGVRRLSERFPAWIAHLLAPLRGSIQLVHVGARPMPELETALGERYHFSAAMPQRDFNALLAASDVLLSFNTSATTIGSACALGVPVLLATSSYEAGSVEELARALGRPLTPEAERWVLSALPLDPFEVWPMGLHAFLAPLLRDNPYMTAVERVEVFDDDAVRAALHRLLFDTNARIAARDAQERYTEQVRRLPTAAALIERYLGASSTAT